MLDADIRLAVIDLLNLHGHLVDDGELDRLDELLAEDVQYDLTDFGGEVLSGIDAFRDASLAAGDRNPVGHHITNILLTPVSPDVIEARSKAIGIKADGTAGSVTYRDVIRLTEHGWRIAQRQVIARRKPLGAA